MPPSPRAAHATVRLALNAALLVFASLAVMSWLTGRWALASLWTGSLLVVFAELLDARGDSQGSRNTQRGLIWLRAIGLGGAVVGAWWTLGLSR